jgi:hypothetical protein
MRNALLNSILIGYKRAVTGVKKLKFHVVILCAHPTVMNENLLPFQAILTVLRSALVPRIKT